jgi:aspartyl-tRNA(Asn)/glutamyl-tRNA(Gln) amidotransferase subunit C
MEIKDIEKLATLARIELTDQEKEAFAKDLESILGYVDQIKEVATTDTFGEGGFSYNVLREDENPNETGAQTETLLSGAPETQDGFVKVKQILS